MTLERQRKAFDARNDPGFIGGLREKIMITGPSDTFDPPLRGLQAPNAGTALVVLDLDEPADPDAQVPIVLEANKTGGTDKLIRCVISGPDGIFGLR